MIHDIIKPLAPQDLAEWTGGDDIRHTMPSDYPVTRWYHQKHGLYVLSAVEVAVDTDGFSPGPEYHLSISKQVRLGKPARCSAEEAAWVLKQFGLEGSEEDNHVPDGKVRNFWRAVADRFIGRECACKETEHKVVEGDYEHRPLE